MKKTLLLLSTLLLSSVALADNINTLADDFSDPALPNWSTSYSSDFAVANGKLTSSAYGRAIIEESTFKVSDHYEVSMSIRNDGTTANHQPIIFGYKDADSKFFTARVKIGIYGRVYIYEHSNVSSGSTLVYYSDQFSLDKSYAHQLKVDVDREEVNLYLDGLLMGSYMAHTNHGSNQVGIYGLYPDAGVELDNFIVRNKDTLTFDFANKNNSSALDWTGEWTPNYRELRNNAAGAFISNDSFIASGVYGASFTWKNTGNVAENSPSLIFNYTDENTPFYSALVETGQDEQGLYDRASIYKYESLTDKEGVLVSSADIMISGGHDNKLSVLVQDTRMILTLNNERVLVSPNAYGLTGKRAGVQYPVQSNTLIIEEFEMTK